MKNLILLSSLLFFISTAEAQMPGGRPGAPVGQSMNMGHLYGKIVNAKTNRGVDGASLQLLATRLDTATKNANASTLKATITKANGDFSLENLPVMGNFTLKVSAIGFKTVEQKVSFGVRMPAGGGGQEGGGMQQMLSMVDKDLGNIKMEEDAANLGNVTVTATARPLFELGVDRKIFNVDQNLVSSGQTATEVMKSIPSVSVDIDGNVTLRNAAPQVFIDGRPTTMTLDQIPADLIDKVELITNPSAKFDASGGNAGILNIVLKKNKKTGINGGIRTGVDSRGKLNLGGDFNFRQNKINFFVNGMYNERKSKTWSTTDRLNTYSVPTTSIYQTAMGINEGAFAMLRGGFDYFIDNRNTISASASYQGGNFENMNDQRIDSSKGSLFTSYNIVDQFSNFSMKNFGSQLSFKHNFEKSGHEFTADVNYNGNNNESDNLIDTKTYSTGNVLKNTPVMQRSLGGGEQKNTTVQADYVNPISDNQKLELGARASLRDFLNDNNQYFFNYGTGKYDISRLLSNSYKYTDKVYAAYATYSFKVNRWNLQLGLRGESSIYEGSLIGKDKLGKDSISNFKVDFPLSIFPSSFITYKLSDKEDLQINYSRRINRPNFFQLMPFINYSDPQNLSKGNPDLRPEFTNSFEISYSNNYKRGANFLASTYFKQNKNLITNFQYRDVNPDTARYYSNEDSATINTYVNANSSFTTGIELTNRMPITNWWELTTSFNLFNSKITLIDAKQGNLTNQRTSWFAKLNNTIKLPAKFSVQLSAEYFAKTVLPQEGGRGGNRGGMWGGGGMNSGTAQGYVNPRYGFDIAIKKDWTWKGGNSASLTLAVNDFLRTQLYSTYSESPFLKQTTDRRRDPQVARLNFNYRFGKFDIALSKRKNTRAEQGGGAVEMMPQ